MADTMIKPEIKIDPATASTPSDMKDVEEYIPDLAIPPMPEEGGAQAWLVRLPKHLWTAWADIYKNHADHEPIQIGTMRVAKNPPLDQDPTKQEMQISLIAAIPQHRNMPLTYDLKLKSAGYDGHAVFSELEKPEANAGKNKRNNAGRPTGIPSKQDRFGSKYKREPVKEGTYGSAIRKNTALAPVIHHTAEALSALNDPVFEKWERERMQKLNNPKSQVTIDDKLDMALHPAGMAKTMEAFSSFNTKPLLSTSNKKKPPKEKAVRIPQAELLDRLDKCFRQYPYWSLKALRNTLKQPEAYIKQTLEQIANLVRSGDFSMQYKLKDEYAIQHQVREEDFKQEKVADLGTDVEGSESEEDEDEEDGEGFEDVVMEG